MSETWYSLSDLQYNPPDKIFSRIVIPADSPWFSGHFPGEPIVPGIAELSAVYDIIQKYHQERGSSIRITSLKKVRFKNIIKPDEILEIKITLDDSSEESHKFEIASVNGTVCSGIISVKKIDNHKSVT